MTDKRNRFVRAVMGWSNPETAGGENVRLYALNTRNDNNPRWEPEGGHTIERGLLQESEFEYPEGDRYLVVHLGSRYVDTIAEIGLIQHIEDYLDTYRME